MKIAPGTRIGPYEIVAELGAGGMGEVYRARDPRLGREVAIKVLSDHSSNDPDARVRFEREARIVSGLHDPHICVLHDIGCEGDTDYLVMELVDGESLATRLERGPLGVAEVVRYGAEIAAALDHAHRAGLVHRDLKPRNVMLSKSGAKLMDFGLARATGPRGVLSGTDVTIAAPVTAAGVILGTFQYMAPEQIEGRAADVRSDVWALGCVLYEMATGRRAFGGTTSASVMSSIMKDEPKPILEIAPAMPLVIDRIVRACLCKDPDQRWQSARDVALALRWPVADAGSALHRATERQFILTAPHVRQLSERNPRLIGYPVTYLDNEVDSDLLVVLLHGVGADAGRFETVLRSSRHRTVAITLTPCWIQS